MYNFTDGITLETRCNAMSFEEMRTNEHITLHPHFLLKLDYNNLVWVYMREYMREYPERSIESNTELHIL